MRFRLLTAALLAAISVPAFAQDAEEASGPFSFNLGVVSDYAFRGVSQTNEGPAVQGGIDWSHDSGLFVGTWASNVDFVDGDQANFEFDFYVGWAGNFSDTLSYKATLLTYVYSDHSAYNYTELLFGLGVGDYLGFQIGYSNDVFNSSETGIYYQATGTYPLPWGELTLNGAVGHYDLEDSNDGSYEDVLVGLSKSFGPMSVDLNYVHATDGVEWGENGGTRVLLATKWAW